MTDHNHMTRDIKPVGVCPACDLSRDEVTSGYVTEEMIERGAVEARAWGVKSSHGDWSDEETQRNCARDILEAAAPAIAAKALREAADKYQTGGWADDLPTGGSRPALILGMSQRAVAWLRARADRIERGES